MIKKDVFINSFIYLVITMMSLNLKFMAGLYIFDILIIIYLLLFNKRIKLQKNKG